MPPNVPWWIRTRGATYLAQPISAADMRAFSRACQHGDGSQLHRALRELLRKAFPWRPSFLWRGDPVDVFFAEPDKQAERMYHLTMSLLPNPRGSNGRP